MNTRTDIAIYHPHRLDPDAFLAGFVARGELAEFLLDKLRKLPPAAAAEHQLIVGQRGMGKTSLLRRLAIGIARDINLAQRYIPLTFREEQYNVRSLDRFWRNCGESLAEWCDSNGKSNIAADLDRKLLTPTWFEAEVAAEAFLAEAKLLGGRPVLFVDNLDLILDALPAEEHWALRRTLQAPGGPILYGAATQFLRQSGDQSAAFYEFFYPHLLESLSEDELLRYLHRLADARGDRGKIVRTILAREPERLRTLHTLTGGNPRVLALVYQLLERAESDAVFSDLEILLDQLTPFYKARVEEYKSDLQRAVIDAIALHWDPITSHDLGKATAVEVTTVSSQLARLRNDGLVEEVPTSGARSGYQLVERFFNIWYLMRHGTRHTRQKIYWLTAFLKSFYAPDELRRMKFEAGPSEQTGWHPLYREALVAATEALTTPAHPTIPDQPNLGSLDSDYVEVEPEPSRTVEAELSSAQALVGKGFRLGALGRSEEAIAVYDEVIGRFGATSDPALRQQVAKALVNKGFRLGLLGRSEEAITVYDNVVDRFGTTSELALREQVARALVNKGARLGVLGRSEEAITVYDNVVSRFETASDSALRERVARALVNKGGRLSVLGRSAEAIKVYEDAVGRFGTANEPAIREQVSRALLNKGGILDALGRSEDEIGVYDDVVNRFGTARDPALASERPLREQVARALANKAVALDALGRTEEEFAVYDDIVARFGTATEPELREGVARALVNKANLLGRVGRGEESIAVCDDVIGRFRAAIEPGLREGVARALVSKGITLGVLGRSEDAITACDEVIGRFGAATEPALRIQVARALIIKAFRLGVLGRSEEAIMIYDDVVDRFGTASDLALRERVARALVNKGVRLGTLARSEEAIAVYDDVVDRFGKSSESELREAATRALLSKGDTLDVLGRNEQAEAAYRHAVDLDPDSRRGWNALGNLLADRLGRFEDAEAAYLQAIRKSADDLPAKADLAWLFIALGRNVEASAVRSTLADIEAPRLALLDAALQIGADNFGAATEYLDGALVADPEALATTFFNDLLRLLRLAATRAYGEKLITWFHESGYAQREAPVYAAFVAFVRGKRFLLDFSPEVRAPSEQIYERLTRQRTNLRSPANEVSKSNRRGRRPKRRAK